MKSNKQRIQMIEANLKENERLYQSGKRKRETYETCKRDGQKRITELRQKGAV